ncbi:hypothetical protein BO94DRAFT_534977 [Aspergillus sclerotioniger CBS 115572]|uniref:Uncharacterized protein n=1 Tax=Aspergillus sclerotioniger CBS 115572 TaxID=1450535 RepID=A0A317WNM3_9EURO|nr:hypothetical protein BO94DRAFT_534977 [Aspergillus sclerotioniger CBS 115572]PWY87973.1 hypothetical protein BO94DRAFT_534977 [Aspergillus sclerotioniger CBS 115572]
MRILVQTLTHLVPSNTSPDITKKTEPYTAKLLSMLNLICKFIWNSGFQPGVQRWYTYGDEFGYNNRMCFFLLDVGDEDEEKVPIQCYEWDGEVFTSNPTLLESHEIQSELNEIPFTPRPFTQEEREAREKTPVQRIVRRRLRKAQFIPLEELEYMRDHPEEMEWLERKVKPRFWGKFLEQLEGIERLRAEEDEQRRLRREWEEAVEREERVKRNLEG